MTRDPILFKIKLVIASILIAMGCWISGLKPEELFGK